MKQFLANRPNRPTGERIGPFLNSRSNGVIAQTALHSRIGPLVVSSPRRLTTEDLLPDLLNFQVIWFPITNTGFPGVDPFILVHFCGMLKYPLTQKWKFSLARLAPELLSLQSCFQNVKEEKRVWPPRYFNPLYHGNSKSRDDRGRKKNTELTVYLPCFFASKPDPNNCNTDRRPDMTSLEIPDSKTTNGESAYSSDLRLTHRFQSHQSSRERLLARQLTCIFHVIPNVGGCAQGMKEEVLKAVSEQPRKPYRASRVFQSPVMGQPHSVSSSRSLKVGVIRSSKFGQQDMKVALEALDFNLRVANHHHLSFAPRRVRGFLPFPYLLSHKTP